MTDNQVMDYVIEQNAKGVSRQKIVTQLMQRGVTIDQIRRIQKKYQKQIKNGALGAEDITAGSKEVKTRLREANGEKREEQKKTDMKNALLTYNRAKTDSTRRDRARITLKVLPMAADIMARHASDTPCLLDFAERYGNAHEFNTGLCLF
jgi:DNA-binding transcriptional MerR regulator